MSVFDLTPVPSTLTMRVRSFAAVYTSGLTGSMQTLDRGGFRWEAIYTYTNISFTKRALLMSVLARLRGQTHRLRVPVYDNPKQGVYGGTPLVDGASQTGSSIDIKGCSNNITDWIKAGDYFGITVNAELELKMATENASSNGSGLATLPFEPSLRASPDDNAVIIVDDGVLGAPTGVFLVATPTVGWTSRPFRSGSELSSVTLSMTEDLFASQA